MEKLLKKVMTKCENERNTRGNFGKCLTNSKSGRSKDGNNKGRGGVVSYENGGRVRKGNVDD
jgi:hypothetical protein